MYPKQWLRDQLQGKPAGSRLILLTIIQDVPLIAIGYNYGKDNTMFFVMTRGAGSTYPPKMIHTNLSLEIGTEILFLVLLEDQK